MNSLPTVQEASLERYWDIVRKLEPDFYLVRLALQETGIEPMLLPKIIRGISNLAIGTGYGKITIFMMNKKVTQVKTEEADEVNRSAVRDQMGEKD